jgi:hypothetical protein
MAWGAMLSIEEIPIKKLKIPQNTIHILHRNGIETFGQLQNIIRAGNLGELRFVGAKRSNEISELASDIAAQPDKFVDDLMPSIPDQDKIFSGENFWAHEIDPEQADAIHTIEIDKLELPRRIVHLLRKHKIRTISDLLDFNESNLLKVKQIGPKSIFEIQDSLKKALNSPANYIDTTNPKRETPTTQVEVVKPYVILGNTKTPQPEKPATWAEIVEPYLLSERDTRIYTLISRFGLTIKTLEEIATDLGITRERVRQIQLVVASRFTRQVGSRYAFSSRILKHATEILAKEKDHLSLNLFRSTLMKDGILGEFSKPISSKLYKTLDPFETLICWLAILGDKRFARVPEDYSIDIDDLRKARSISIKNRRILQEIPRKRIRNLLRKVAYTGGITLKDAMKVLSTPEDVTLLELKNLKLHRIRDQWFSIQSLKGRMNRLPIVLAGHKMLAVTNEVLFSDFYDGLRRRAGRFFDSISPPDIILHYIKVAGFEVSNDKVFISTEVGNVLSETEKCFVEVAKVNGNVVNFIEVAEEFLQNGFSIAAVSVVLAHSPLVEKIDTGLYKIRGVSVLWQDIENAKKRQKSFSKDAEIIYGLDGTIRYRVSLNSWAVYTGVLSTNMLRDLAGEWKSNDKDGRLIRINMDELFIWGIGNKLKEMQANIGDRIELLFNTWNRTLAIQKVEHGDT